MATITFGPLFANLNRWAGHLMQDDNQDFVVTTQTATTFSYRLSATDPDLPNYRVTVQGTGLQYDADGAIGGTMTSVRIFDPAGALILTIANLAPNTLASDFAQFYSNVFGSVTLTGDGPGPDPNAAWSHLLSGNDVFNGTAADDRRSLPGIDLGNDRYNMGAGEDFVGGGAGNDTMDGGADFDTLSYGETTYNIGNSAFRGVNVNMNTGIVLDPWGGRDVISNFEQVFGSRFNDTFIGNDTLRDRFSGLRGRDTFDGGADSYDVTGTIRTDDRRDEVRYDEEFWNGGRRGIIVDLETNNNLSTIQGTIRDTFGNLDTVIDIERVIGTRFDDIFVGSRMNNRFGGGEGVDRYNGAAGDDAIDFGRSFINDPQFGAVVDLTRASGQVQNDGFGNVETAISIEELAGTDLNDRFSGTAQYNFLEGRDGSDTLTGRGGSDYFYWDNEGVIGDADRITDFTATGPDSDYLSFFATNFTGMTGTAVVVNGTAATQAVGTFIYNAVNDTLYWDEDGTGGAQAVRVAILNNVASLSAANFDIFT